MFKRKNGEHNIQYFKKKASTAFTNGGLVNVDANGFLIPATATSVNHLGVVLKDVASTDADYASTTYLPVDVARTTDLFEADTTSGSTPSQTAVGAFYDLNSTGTSVDLTATTTKQVYVQEILSTSAGGKVVVIVNSTAGADETGA